MVGDVSSKALLRKIYSVALPNPAEPVVRVKGS